MLTSSVLAEKKTASLWLQDGQRTSRVRGSVGSARTSCQTAKHAVRWQGGMRQSDDEEACGAHSSYLLSREGRAFETPRKSLAKVLVRTVQ